MVLWQQQLHKSELMRIRNDRRQGLDMSGAVNLFLRQCVLRGGLPFAVEMPRYNQEALAAMEEGRRIARDPSVKGYTNMADLKKALEQE